MNQEELRGKPVPVIVPTRDEQGLVGRSTAILWNVFWALGRHPVYVHASCVGYAKVRTDSFVEARKNVDTDNPRGVMIDDDMLLTDMDALAKAVLLADKNNWNIVAPYKAKDGRVVITKTDGSMLTLDEYKQLKPYDVVPGAGLGFYYGTLPLKYEFHADGKPFLGEDLNFWHDLGSTLKPRIAPIPIKHLKVMAL